MKIKEVFELGHPAYLTRFENKREFVVGCEFEVEDIQNVLTLPNKIQMVEDNSLRNSGREFTTHPSTLEETLVLFDTLYKSLKLGDEPFSERTSIHVHVNVRELTLIEVRQLTLLYALLEPLFFEFVGDVRKNSIFCVPLNYTYLPNYYKDDTLGHHNKWHKYTAFNLKPLNHFGTIEFRHMYGTNDKVVFTKWLTILKSLFEFIANKTDFNIIEYLKEGVTPYELALMSVPMLVTKNAQQTNELLADTLLDVKLASGGLK